MASPRQLLEQLWAHRAGFARIMSHPNWARGFQAVSVLSFMMAVYVYYQQQSFIECVAGYNDAQARSSAARSQSFQQSLQAVDTSIHAVATATSRDQVSAALKAYEARRLVLSAQLESNPLPAPPSERCG